MNLYS